MEGRQGHFSNLKQIKKLICWLFLPKLTSPLESCVFCIMKLKSWNHCCPPSSLFVGISVGSHLTWGCGFFLLFWPGFNRLISLPVLKTFTRLPTAGRIKSKTLMGLARPWELSALTVYQLFYNLEAFGSCHFPHLMGLCTCWFCYLPILFHLMDPIHPSEPSTFFSLLRKSSFQTP